MGVAIRIHRKKVKEVLNRVIKNENDILICITGNEGSGKSTLAYWLAKMVNPDFDVRNIIYFAENFIDSLYEAPEESVVMCDENPFYKRDAMMGESKWGTKTIQRARFKKRVYIICLPRLGYLDKDLRDTRCRLWFKVIKRGYAEVYTPMEDREIGDPWLLDDPKAMRRKCGEGYMKFRKMPEEDNKIYIEMKIAGFKQMHEEYKEWKASKNGKCKISEESVVKFKVISIPKIANYFNKSEKLICEILGINYNSYRVMKSNYSSNQ